MIRHFCALSVVIVMALEIGCSFEEGLEPESRQAAIKEAASPVRAMPAFDVYDVIRRSHHAFSRRTDGLVGGDHTYGVLVQSTGTIRFTPIHYPAIVSSPPAANSQPHVSGSPLELTTTSIFRSVELKDDLDSPRAMSSGSAKIEHSRVSELLENTADGLRQEWLFDSSPPGRGDLRVEVLASGQSYVGATASGLHFRDDTTGLGTRYGSIKWVDADGVATALDAEFKDDRIVMTVSEELLAASTYPALLDPTIGPELQMDVATSGPAAGTQTEPDIAHGPQFLIVWSDNRRWLEAGPVENDIFGARVTAAGVLVDTVGIPICVDVGDEIHPAATYGPAMLKYAVVWEDRREYATKFSDIYGTRVEPSSGYAEPATPINNSNSDTLYPDVAWGTNSVSGGNFLVVWDLQSGLGNIGHQRLDQNFVKGMILDGTVDSTFGPRNNPTVAGSTDVGQSAFFIAWEASGDVKGRRMEQSSGTMSPVQDIAVSGLAERTPDVAYREQDFFVVWLETAADGFQDVRSRLMAGSNGVATTGPVTLSDGNSLKAQVAVATDFNQRGYVAWQDFRFDADGDIYGARATLASASITPLDLTGDLVNGDSSVESFPALHYNDANEFFVVYRKETGGNPEIYGTRVDATTGNSISSVMISKSSNRHSVPAVAFDGTNYLVVFLDRKLDGNYVPDLRASLVSPTGTILVSGITLTIGSGADNPAVIYDGTGNYYVVWMDFRSGTNWDIYGARVRASDGVSLDLLGNKPIVTLSSTQMYPAVSFGGAHLLVSWQDFRNGTDYDVWGARVSPATGAVVGGSEQNISNAVGNQMKPRSAFGGTNHLVVWEDTRNANFVTDIYGRFVSAAGVLGSTIAIANVYEHQRLPTVAAFVSEKYVVAWEDERNIATSATDIYGARVEAGAAFPNFAISSQSGIDEFAPELAWNGLNYVTVWWQRAVGGSPFTDDVKGQLVTSVGGLSGTVFNVAAQANVRERTPALACNATSNVCLVTYTKYNSADGTDRIMGVTVAP